MLIVYGVRHLFVSFIIARTIILLRRNEGFMNRNRRTLSLTLIATFVLMALLVVYTTRLMYTSSSSYILELGNDKAAAITADLENYLDTAKSVLWVTADTVDHMLANGATDAEIVEYITRE